MVPGSILYDSPKNDSLLTRELRTYFCCWLTAIKPKVRRKKKFHSSFCQNIQIFFFSDQDRSKWILKTYFPNHNKIIFTPKVIALVLIKVTCIARLVPSSFPRTCTSLTLFFFFVPPLILLAHSLFFFVLASSVRRIDKNFLCAVRFLTSMNLFILLPIFIYHHRSTHIPGLCTECLFIFLRFGLEASRIF